MGKIKSDMDTLIGDMRSAAAQRQFAAAARNAHFYQLRVAVRTHLEESRRQRREVARATAEQVRSSRSDLITQTQERRTELSETLRKQAAEVRNGLALFRNELHACMEEVAVDLARAREAWMERSRAAARYGVRSGEMRD